MTAAQCLGVISGLGFGGYVAALRHLAGLWEGR
jgi:3-dehydroquinate dehydratase